MYLFAEKYENEWREEKGYDDGELFEDYFEIHNGADNLTSISNWRSEMLADRADPDKLDYILDNSDIGSAFNHMAVQALTSDWDHFSMRTNTLQYKDGDTGRWSLLFWDMDGTLQADSRGQSLVSPFDVQQTFADEKFPTAAIYEQPELRELYLRRLRTLVDKLYANDAFHNKYTELADQFEPEMQLDLAKWPADMTSGRNDRNGQERTIAAIKSMLLTYMSRPWGLPATQTDQDRQQVSIGQVVSDANNANEYIRLDNAADTPVDVSGWVVEGIDYTIPAGAVVPANGSMYLLRDDAAYKVAHDPVLVAGQYTTDLSDVAGTFITLKTETGLEIDDHDY